MRPTAERGRPLIIAHRGLTSGAPENTVAAFRAAAEAGADGVELDVRLSRDGEVVVLHDHGLERTTNGTGPAARRSLAEMKRLDIRGLPRRAHSHAGRGLRRAAGVLPHHRRAQGVRRGVLGAGVAGAAGGSGGGALGDSDDGEF